MIQSEWRLSLPHSPAVVFGWHDRPGALKRLLPPWENARVVASSGHIRAGAEVRLEMRVGPLRTQWHAKHVIYEPPERFEDSADKSPFAHWHHSHVFSAEGEGTALLDQVTWKLPLHALTAWLVAPWVKRRLDVMFNFRHRRTAEDLARLARWGGKQPLRVAVTGASGGIGGHLCALLSTGGHEVIRLTRRASAAPDELQWDPTDPNLHLPGLEGVDVVVHLAGEPLAAGRWSDARKAAILDSRESGTRNLVSALSRLERPPRKLVSASAIGIYGNREVPVDESSAAGEGFLAEVCERWERAAETAKEAGIVVATARIGVVLDPRSGALAKMLPIWRAGLGGPVGGGRQGFSWVSQDDVLGALLLLASRDELTGPFNLVSPEVTDNAGFARTLGRVLKRPALLPVPRLAIETLYGEMGRETVLSGAVVKPTRLQEAGFKWDQPDLEGALRFVLGAS